MLWNLHIYIYLSLYYYNFQRFGTKYDHAHLTVFIYEHYIGCFFFSYLCLTEKRRPTLR
jgi:hypothetical protein